MSNNHLINTIVSIHKHCYPNINIPKNTLSQCHGKDVHDPKKSPPRSNRSDGTVETSDFSALTVNNNKKH
jgi:hypothetical protein